MEFAITKMSQNGQVVIPSEIRKDAKIKPSTKFVVVNQGKNILLKRISKEEIRRGTLELLKKIEKAEKQIKEGKYVKANTDMSAEEIDDLLMK
jgi:AbrB family looped-hinge helix DNA binding protein